jgi:SpoVK/Ycf46/Vps4 family AAA+-type ATPase
LIEFFIPPPDLEAKEEIYNLYLQELPIEPLNYTALATLSHNFSGADISGVVSRVSEKTIEQILQSGEELRITQKELEQMIQTVKPTTMEWFESAKNVVEYANENGIYDELGEYLKNSLHTKSKKMGFL